MPDLVPYSETEMAERRAAFGPRVRVAVNNTVDRQYCCGIVWPAGEHTAVVPLAAVDKLKALVEPDVHLIEQARKLLQKDIEEAAKKGLQSNAVPSSFEAKFRQITGRDLLPFRSVDVVEKDLPPKLSPEEERQVHIQKAMTAGGPQSQKSQPGSVSGRGGRK